MNRIRGILHLIVVIAFLTGAFLIDFDHSPFSIREAWRTMFNKCDDEYKCSMHRGLLHHQATFYILLSLALGVYIHLKMDGVL